MKKYEWILFDADETLFRFDAFCGLQRMFSQFSVNFTEQDYQEYQTVNKALWVDYQNGDITSHQLQRQRFDRWASRLQIPSHDLNSAFLTAMLEISHPLEGALSLISNLKGKAKLGIITNGFIELQRARLEHTGLQNYFDVLVISEEVGIAKPHPKIFEHAFLKMGNPDRTQVLMVGDTLESDILGGMNAGIDTCWINTHNKVLTEGIKPNYQVASLSELEKLLFS